MISCRYILERPDARRRRGNRRYIVVLGQGEPDLDDPASSDQDVAGIETPDKVDMEEVWARQDLAHRGCLKSLFTAWRDCDPSSPLGLPAIPPLPE